MSENNRKLMRHIVSGILTAYAAASAPSALTVNTSETAEWVNGLPDRERRYIHDLETKCDPAGDIRTIADLTLQRDALAIRVEELEQPEAAPSALLTRIVKVLYDADYTLMRLADGAELTFGGNRTLRDRIAELLSEAEKMEVKP